MIPENERKEKGETTMTIDKNLAMKLWYDIYGNTDWANDCFGTHIYKYDYGVYDKERIRPNGTGKRYNYGWDIDHIRPKSSYNNENEASFYNNLQPLHHSNNIEKSDGYEYIGLIDQSHRSN